MHVKQYFFQKIFSFGYQLRYPLMELTLFQLWIEKHYTNTQDLFELSETLSTV